MNNLENFVGKGITFPIELNNGSPIIRSNLDIIKSSLRMILNTPLDSRFYLAEFGSRTSELLEEPTDDLLVGLVEHFIIESIRKWERRIELLGTEVLIVDEKKISIRIDYRIINSSVSDSFVYPFYRNLLY